MSRLSADCGSRGGASLTRGVFVSRVGAIPRSRVSLADSEGIAAHPKPRLLAGTALKPTLAAYPNGTVMLWLDFRGRQRAGANAPHPRRACEPCDSVEVENTPIRSRAGTRSRALPFETDCTTQKQIRGSGPGMLREAL